VRRPVRSARRDSGAAIVEFVLVTVVLLTLFMGLVQLGLALYARNTIAACAADGARYAANADRSTEDGAGRTRTLISGALAASFADDVTASRVVRDGVAQIEVRVRAPIPMFGFLGPRSLTVVAHALDEG
jgi:Flp pilus assembly protein TadG